MWRRCLRSGIVYNVGLTAGPWFEGMLVQRLYDISQGLATFSDMAMLASAYLVVIGIVQGMRAVKRYAVRRFANDTSRSMRHTIYHNLVNTSREELERESVGTMMTKAIADVDACAEGMRKVTTEVFDTGVALVSYMVMLLVYDWRLALISCLFTPIAYFAAQGLRKVIYRCNAAFKRSAGALNDATLDRVSSALVYRVYGRDAALDARYESKLDEYEHTAVMANIWGAASQPVYQVISLAGVVAIIYFGARNIVGTGWSAWDLASFTTFMACFAKLAVKSSHAANLFNAIQKAQVSWRRIKPLMHARAVPPDESAIDFSAPMGLSVEHLRFTYPDAEVDDAAEGESAEAGSASSSASASSSSSSPTASPSTSLAASPSPSASLATSPTLAAAPSLADLSFSAAPGSIVGVTGPVASGKSTLGKVFLCEAPYKGSIRIGGHELSELSGYERSRLVSYMGHAPELMSDTVAHNVSLGDASPVDRSLVWVQLADEVAALPQGADTPVGDGGMRLSGGQQQRVALARTLYHDAHVLVLDDPFSAVDKPTERAIMEAMERVCADRVCLVISHRLELFPRFSQVIWMENGHATVSTHEALMTDNARYRQLYEAQMAGGDLDDE